MDDTCKFVKSSNTPIWYSFDGYRPFNVNNIKTYGCASYTIRKSFMTEEYIEKPWGIDNFFRSLFGLKPHKPRRVYRKTKAHVWIYFIGDNYPEDYHFKSNEKARLEFEKFEKFLKSLS